MFIKILRKICNFLRIEKYECVDISTSIDRLESRGEKVVTEAVINAGRILEVTDEELAKIIHVKKDFINDYRLKEKFLLKNHKSFHLSVEFIRLFCYLDDISFGDEKVSRAFLRNYNKGLKGKPIDLIQKSPKKLREVIDYFYPEPGY